MKIAIILGIMVLVFNSCKSHNCTNENNIKYQYILIGSGGGGFPTYTGYSISSLGELRTFKSNNSGQYEYSEPVTVSKDIVESAFQSLKNSGFYEENFNHPGNVSYFIQLKDDSSNTKSVTWGSPSHNPSSKITDYYKTMNEKFQSTIKNK